ncbi:MAG: sigma 54-interacting transcriptional regulator [Desulfobulbaceae bacterium]|nr:sigma 54-interacting transcriptional regulator [Desulfobulbaceae bacterium]HIJ89637.1 sigma 54-interacting transcriptional regulator [Deltaproteobacteria bacterium]
MIDLEKSETSILVVDDEESLRLTFQMFLGREGYGPVVTASTFEEAMGLIEQQTFDLIISDIVMEGASGIDLLRVRELGLECPMVMVTGYPNINTASEAVRLGAFDYLAKPVKKADLLRTARMALQQYSLWKEKERLTVEKERYQQYLETIFRSVRDMIVTVDHDLRVVQMNDQAKNWAATHMPGLAIGTNLEDVADSFAVFAADVQKVLECQEAVSEHRIEVNLETGGHVVFRISASPLESQQDKGFLGVVLVFRDVSRLEDLEKRGKRTYFHRLAGVSRAMQTVYTLIENVGQVDTSVLITGESGTGKELVAEALHAESPRREMPLVKFDCTSIPENLMESELFGHKKGAFTGADRNREGRILQADGGTLFLDEIGDISPLMQLRLLRFLQERTFYPVGEDRPVTVDVRVVAATNADLKQKVQRGEFREDLYYRLRVIDISLPPLRDRQGDLPILVELFLARFSKRLNKNITGISDQALQLLTAYRWPGNVRELEHVVERACVLCTDDTITTANLPEEVRSGDRVVAASANGAGTETVFSAEAGGFAPVSRENEEAHIVSVIAQTDGNKAKAARLLGIDRSTLYRKMKAYGLE